MSRLRSVRRRRPPQGEAGFTLVELMVSMTLLVVIAGIIAIVYGVGFTDILAPGAAQSRIAAVGNMATLQQLVTKDIERASCAVTGPVASPQCASVLSRCAWSDSDLLCLGWGQVSETPSFAVACQVVLYSAPSQGIVEREMWSGGAATTDLTVGSAPNAHGPANAVVMTASASPQASPATVTVTLSSPGIRGNPPSASFTVGLLPTGPQIDGIGITAATPC